MSLIPQDKIQELKPAADVAAVAATAALEIEQATVAYTINTAANNGNTNVEINYPISKATIDLLHENGYSVKYPMAVARPGDLVIISWEPEE